MLSLGLKSSFSNPFLWRYSLGHAYSLDTYLKLLGSYRLLLLLIILLSTFTIHKWFSDHRLLKYTGFGR